MHTEQYKLLINRICKLKSLYLPSNTSPTGEYDDNDYERVLAFNLLVHAEIEYYFEQSALLIAGLAYDMWDKKQISSKVLLALAVYYDGTYAALPDDIKGNRRNEDINKRIKDAYTRYNHYIRSNNHGIKTKNLLNIFLPIGIQVEDLDENMLTAMDNFGAKRGIIAHSTNSNRAIHLEAPDDAENKISNIMAYINKFDEFLNEHVDTLKRATL